MKKFICKHDNGEIVKLDMVGLMIFLVNECKRFEGKQSPSSVYSAIYYGLEVRLNEYVLWRVK